MVVHASIQAGQSEGRDCDVVGKKPQKKPQGKTPRKYSPLNCQKDVPSIKTEIYYNTITQIKSKRLKQCRSK